MTTWWHVLLRVKYFIPQLQSGRGANLGWSKAGSEPPRAPLHGVPAAWAAARGPPRAPRVPTAPGVTCWLPGTGPSGAATAAVIFPVLQTVIKEAANHFYINVFQKTPRGGLNRQQSPSCGLCAALQARLGLVEAGGLQHQGLPGSLKISTPTALPRDCGD